MKIFAANWKLHKTPQETRDFFEQWKNLYQVESQKQIVFFPPATSLEATSQSLAKTSIQWGSQNCHSEVKGAFTGEISAQVVKDLGGQFVLIGHSERRSLFGETDDLISKKVALVQSLGLTPMLCIGESLAEREASKTLQTLKVQLEKGLALADRQKALVIAYEPIWAIGTGKVANLEQVREAHQGIHTLIRTMGFKLEVPILYGGSVKAEHAKELIAVPSVDGFLVGGASLEVSSFLQICQA